MTQSAYRCSNSYKFEGKTVPDHLQCVEHHQKPLKGPQHCANRSKRGQNMDFRPKMVLFTVFRKYRGRGGIKRQRIWLKIDVWP